MMEFFVGIKRLPRDGDNGDNGDNLKVMDVGSKRRKTMKKAYRDLVRLEKLVEKADKVIDRPGDYQNLKFEIFLYEKEQGRPMPVLKKLGFEEQFFLHVLKHG